MSSKIERAFEKKDKISIKIMLKKTLIRQLKRTIKTTVTLVIVATVHRNECMILQLFVSAEPILKIGWPWHLSIYALVSASYKMHQDVHSGIG